jgi:hypothetical protein
MARTATERSRVLRERRACGRVLLIRRGRRRPTHLVIGFAGIKLFPSDERAGAGFPERPGSNRGSSDLAAAGEDVDVAGGGSACRRRIAIPRARRRAQPLVGLGFWRQGRYLEARRA